MQRGLLTHLLTASATWLYCLCSLFELQYSKATSKPACWVLAVPENSPVQRAEDLEGTIVASELVETTKK